ncbi:MAG: hypothetical protein ABI678_24645 [Kofleriaceae bacterium]
MKRIAQLVVLALSLSAVTAHADVGVVVTGEASLQPQLLAHLEGWLKKRGHNVYSSALEPDAINTLIDCFVIEDLNCAKKVIEIRAKSDAIIYARVSIAPSDNGKRDISIVGYWVQKGHDTLAERRVCHGCTEKQMHDTVEDLMLILGANPPTGSHVHVPPPSVAAAGAPALDPEAPLSPPSDERPSRAVPLTLIGVGAAAAITGVVFLITDEDPPTSGPQPEKIWDVGTAGAICLGAGVVTAGVGAYLWTRTGSQSAPVASVTHDGAVIGWAGRF